MSIRSGIMVVALVAMLTGCTAVRPASDDTATATAPALSKPSAEPTSSVVEPVVVVASVDVDGAHVTASGYVGGIVEDGGSCVFTMSSADGASSSQRASGTADRSTTSCGTVAIPTDGLTRGAWSVSLSYEDREGTITQSAPIKVQLP